MTKRKECKFKVSRRIGKPLWSSNKDPVHKKNYPAGQHGPSKGYKRRIGYAEQAESAHVLCTYYGNITKKQFRRIVQTAKRRKGDTIENMIAILESRLDTLVYRSKFAPTPFSARQIVNHKHILVNGKVVNIPSYQVKLDDVIEVREKSKELTVIAESLARTERSIPEYIQLDEAAKSSKYIRVPSFTEVPYGIEMKPSLVIEFYSY